MIGSIGSIGESVRGEGIDKTVRRASGRYVEAAEGMSTGGERQLALADLRAAPQKDALHAAIAAGNPASAPFVAQLAALGLGDAVAGERRVRRDPSLIAARADALYRDGYRRVTDLEPGFFGAAEY
ncbi:hypothetical protein [Pleomorphomonas carboxyditropha]|uniref:Uncharacterized protein n=1 Tax=Pleomorphomonas carboxyditropha TaxID=2023338 RepID=A0A2G9WUN6_9HYPH|nr:hypothetical protein [Pleomorphomonas carboxyditropha]PIO98415.1 hypothetical protein CJ014_15765 [Pleomorphomonas carboxyditropha]